MATRRTRPARRWIASCGPRRWKSGCGWRTCEQRGGARDERANRLDGATVRRDRVRRARAAPVAGRQRQFFAHAAFCRIGRDQRRRGRSICAITYAEDGTITAYRRRPAVRSAVSRRGNGHVRGRQDAVVFGLRHSPAAPGKLLARHDRAGTAVRSGSDGRRSRHCHRGMQRDVRR